MTGMVETGVLGAKVEEKLFQNRYLVDAGRPHIKFARTILRRRRCARSPIRARRVVTVSMTRARWKSRWMVASNAGPAVCSPLRPARSSGNIHAVDMAYCSSSVDNPTMSAFRGAKPCDCRKPTSIVFLKRTYASVI